MTTPVSDKPKMCNHVFFSLGKKLSFFIIPYISIGRNIIPAKANLPKVISIGEKSDPPTIFAPIIDTPHILVEIKG